MEREEIFFDKTPFYMTYPMQNLFEAEMEYEKDLERIKQWYPKEISYIEQLVEERCDEMEYEGSRLYDEEPDQLMMQQMAMEIYDKVCKERELKDDRFFIQSESLPENSKKSYFSEVCEFQLEAESCDNRRRCDDWLCSIVEILFYNETYRRRCRHRRCRRWW